MVSKLRVKERPVKFIFRRSQFYYEIFSKTDSALQQAGEDRIKNRGGDISRNG